MKDGRRFGRPPNRHTPPATPEGKINLSDPDSRLVKGMRGRLQGYNAQAVTTEEQIVIAAELMTASPDFGHLEPMIETAERELRGRRRRRGTRHGARRRRLSAPRTDAEPRRARHPGPHPARLQSTQGSTARLGGRRLRLHAPRPGHRTWQRSLPPAPAHGRAGVRRHEVQPALGPLPTPRQSRRTNRVAAHRRDAQPPEALAAHDRAQLA